MQQKYFYLKDVTNDHSTKLFCFSTGFFNATHTFLSVRREIDFGIAAHKKVPLRVHAAEYRCYLYK